MPSMGHKKLELYFRVVKEEDKYPLRQQIQTLYLVWPLLPHNQYDTSLTPVESLCEINEGYKV